MRLNELCTDLAVVVSPRLTRRTDAGRLAIGMRAGAGRGIVVVRGWRTGRSCGCSAGLSRACGAAG
jgi:hypothetical protein